MHDATLKIPCSACNRQIPHEPGVDRTSTLNVRLQIFGVLAKWLEEARELGSVPCRENTCILTPWSRMFLEKLTSSQLVKKFHIFCGTRRFITAFTSARDLSLS